MRHPLAPLALAVVLVVPGSAAGLNRTHLVPALKECPGPANCSPREFESRYTFDSIVLRSTSGRYLPVGKPSIVLEVKGVRDPAGTPVTGNLTLKVLSGRVSTRDFGTFPDDFPLAQVAPVPVPLKNGSNKKFAYQQPDAPSGVIVNGGGVEVYDPEGKRLATTGSQTK